MSQAHFDKIYNEFPIFLFPHYPVDHDYPLSIMRIVFAMILEAFHLLVEVFGYNFLFGNKPSVHHYDLSRLGSQNLLRTEILDNIPLDHLDSDMFPIFPLGNN